MIQKQRKIKALLINNTLNVSLLNGDTVVFNNATKQIWEIVSKFTEDQEVIDYYFTTQKNELPPELQTKEVAKVKKETEIKQLHEKAEKQAKVIENINNGYQSLINTGDFEVKEGSVYLIGINLTLPELLVTKLLEVVDKNPDEYYGLINFWKWATLAGSSAAREDLFRYLQVQGLSVNKHGFFFAYRKIVSVKDSKSALNKNLVEFVSASYLKIKSQKKSPKNFTICRGIEEYSCIATDRLIGTEIQAGNLFDLYQNLGNDEIQEQMFTDAHTHKFDIRIGREVTEDPAKCEWNNKIECAASLHVGAKDFGCGDTSILVLVNPKNVVAVPSADCYKMRVCAYMPLAILPTDHKFDLHLNESLIDVCDEYFNDQVDKLNELVANNSPEELIQHKLIMDTSAIDLIKKVEFLVPEPSVIISARTVDYTKSTKTHTPTEILEDPDGYDEYDDEEDDWYEDESYQTTDKSEGGVN